MPWRSMWMALALAAVADAAHAESSELRIAEQYGFSYLFIAWATTHEQRPTVSARLRRQFLTNRESSPTSSNASLGTSSGTRCVPRITAQNTFQSAGR